MKLQKEIKYLVFDNDPCNYNEDEVREAFIECNGHEPSESELWEFVYSDIEMNYDAEKANLGVLDNLGDVIAIASLGLWNGRRFGIAVLPSVRDCLRYTEDYASFYVEENDFQSVRHHHDGTNYIYYRLPRAGYDIDDIVDRIREAEFDFTVIDKFTKSLAPHICKVYGWNPQPVYKVFESGKRIGYIQAPNGKMAAKGVIRNFVSTQMWEIHKDRCGYMVLSTTGKCLEIFKA